MTPARWVVFGYHTIGAWALEALLDRGEHVVAVVTHEDDPGENVWFESVAELARKRGVPVLTPASPNRPEVAQALAALAPDVFLSVWYRRLLGAELLAVPRVAALNLHGSLLPAYRGRAPINWVLVNGERRTGVTLHHMTVEADAGDIVAQEAIDIPPSATALTLYRRVAATGVDLLTHWYPAVLAGVAPRIPQDHTRATVCGRRRPEDGRISWDWPAERIANMVRAVTHPFPGAFAGDGPNRMILWWTEPTTGVAGVALPGTIVALAADGVRVATGQGVLLLKRVQCADRDEEPAESWAARAGVRPGQRMPALA